jgi:hypothetical protein
MSALPTPGADVNSQVAALSQQLAIYTAGIHRLEKLAEPAADRATLQATFKKVDDASNLLKEEIAAQQSGDAAKASSMSDQVSAAGNTANLALSAYGLTSCEEN